MLYVEMLMAGMADLIRLCGGREVGSGGRRGSWVEKKLVMAGWVGWGAGVVSVLSGVGGVVGIVCAVVVVSVFGMVGVGVGVGVVVLCCCRVFWPGEV
jgi:hypothetical protein